MALAGDPNPLAIRTLADIDRMMAFVAHKPRAIPGQFKRIAFNDVKAHEPLLDKVFTDIATDALEAPLNDQLGKVGMPTLIIWGRHDRLIDVSCATVQHQGIPGSELAIFEDVGHVPMIEQPGPVAARHLAFLAKHRSTPMAAQPGEGAIAEPVS
jgi:pimeloyl-ACP methyl ester carboxylesterase